MAPSLTQEQPPSSTSTTTPSKPTPQAPSPSKIPLTSGQHNPIYSQLHPYTSFPTQITGPTVWNAADYKHNPERWTHHFSPSEIAELNVAIDAFLASKADLTTITTETFPLPTTLGPLLTSVRNELINGKGFILFKGFPVEEWGNERSAVAYMGLGTYLGHFVSQNGRGHVLGHVKDLGEDSRQIDKVRIYRTNARQFFHTDDSDIVGLLCMHKAFEGGESDIISTHHVYNTLQKEHPDVVDLLTQPIWYFDRKGEVSKGEEEYTRQPVLYLSPTDDGGQRVYCKWDPYYVRSLTRLSSLNLIPALTPSQTRAMHILEETCLRLSLHMILAPGDIQFLSNTHVLHARTEYKDFPPPAPRRHLMRLWLSVPDAEGGWRLPFHDSGVTRRGGIQVDGTRAVAPLDAE
ncbi:taurine catabolism dioxygenase TauD [Aulographum hederae CBS 113979]|uniref:Taurine catabolism dioxygenase TauD n=1 Tax=Aulographum hederae CBS 113979 TaxID=1176131 RepID=A0A6G1GTJ2_9PEZI|nr:taurine catabolism dioxygenase TauD [Aulographum hederae CBS 113979]